MAYADDLLKLAQEIASLHLNEAHQPSLRRALSTAYYALFHLLISDAVATCTDDQFRATLARVFDHGPMKQASDKAAAENSLLKTNLLEEPEKTIRAHLRNVAEIFSQAQYNRKEADYNLL